MRGQAASPSVVTSPDVSQRPFLSTSSKASSWRGSRPGHAPRSAVLAVAGLENGGDGGVATRELQRVRGQFRQDGLVPCARRGQRLPSDDLPLPDEFAQQYPV